MAQNNFAVDWQHKISQAQLDEFYDLGFFVVDDCFEAADFCALQQESGFVSYQQATLTQGERISHIRGDNIRWIDEECAVGARYLNCIEKLGAYLNQLFFLGIWRAEAHYAYYPAGFGYEWHKDNPKGRDDRVVSAVFYLNDEWTADDGGQIVLVDNTDCERNFVPKGNRLVVFDSNLLHKVAITHKTRFSIATWLRRDKPLT